MAKQQTSRLTKLPWKPVKKHVHRMRRRNCILASSELNLEIRIGRLSEVTEAGQETTGKSPADFLRTKV
jgi:hypothetical protein